MTRRLLVRLLGIGLLCSPAWPQGGELRFCLRAEPKTFHPLLVADSPSETIRYLTGGVLMRLNRATQQHEPELAVAWKVLEEGRKITFQLREKVLFSDGTPFSADDVAFTIKALMDPEMRSPTGDSFRSGAGQPVVQVLGPHRVTITFPAPVAGLERLFDQVAIMSARSLRKELAVLGPFSLLEHKAGSHVLLGRNPQYWKRDEKGKRLPYLDAIRLDIQRNRDIEMLRFRRGEIHMINNLDPELFERLEADAPHAAHDAGVSLDSEFLWFNQAPQAAIPAYKKSWFRSKGFRRAVSEAINRDDLCRVVFRGHARPGVGPVSPANRFWFRAGLEPHRLDSRAALRRLEQEGFRRDRDDLRDKDGNLVEFSLITNAGNKPRERMAAMIQQDLAQLGIRLNVVPLDFSSVLDRMTRSFDYEACLLGLVNNDLDPNSQMNVWLSSSSNHQWNPSQKSPATAWEAELDRLMQAQASTADSKKRKAHFDKVQEIVWEEAPFVYLVHKNALCAISSALKNAAPVMLGPQTYWNAERIQLAGEIARN